MKKKSKAIAKKSKVAKKLPKLSKPVFSGPDVLPFLDKGFSWNKFERFSRQFLELLFPKNNIAIYGKAGNKQKGIDLLVQDSKTISYVVQCKQYSSYSITNFKAAKKALKVKAKKNILFLACEADVKLRDEVLRDPTWEVWDCNDLTAKIMRLDSDKRFQLVKTYFGSEWAKAFSDHQEYSPFASGVDFFRHQLSEDRVFNHCGPFLGRVNDLKKLYGFIENRSAKAFILSGVGGVGKSRLVWELHKEAKNKNWNVLFVREGIEATREDFQRLKGKKQIFIFDDAHRLSDLNNYFSYLLQADFDFKIVISTRPQGRERIRLDLRQLSFEEKEIQELPLMPLNAEDSKKLINRLLPGLNAEHSSVLARIANDSLLIGVMACNLIKQKELSLGKLSNEADIREQALFKFKDEILGKLTGESNHALNRSVLETVSAFSPISISHNVSIQKLSAFIGASEQDFMKSLGELEAYGLIMNRGDQIRISPDILSDCILEDTCFLKNGKPSGYFGKAFDVDVDYLRVNLLRNIAELDWRKKENGTASSTLLREFWGNLLSSISSVSLSQKVSILSMIEPIAYFQAQESLSVVKALLSSNTEAEDKDNRWQYRSYVESISKIIRDVIISGIQVNEAVTLLWNLGKGDQRNLNPHPDHPIRILQDLSSYSKNMSIAHYERILDSLILLVEDYDKSDFHNPIELLSGLLQKTAHSTHSEGNKFVMTPFHISPKKTAKIREKIYELLKRKIVSSNLKEANAVVKVLEGALQGPAPIFNMKITPKQIRQWDKEMTAVMNILADSYGVIKLPLIRLEIKRVLRRFLRYGAKKAFQPKVKSFFAKYKLTSEEEFYLIFQLYNYDDLVIAKDHEDYSRREEEMKKVGEEVTKKLIEKFPLEKNLVHKVNQIAAEFATIKDHVHLWYFSYFCYQNPKIDNERMCLALLEANSKYLETNFSTFLRGVAEKDLERALKLIDKAIGVNNTTILASIAGDFWHVFDGHLNNASVKKMFEVFLLHEEDRLRDQALGAIRMLNHKKESDLAIECMEKAKVVSSSNAQNLLGLIDDRYGLPTDLVSEELTVQLLDKIKEIESLEHHEIQEFIELCSKRIPEQLIDFLIYRINSTRMPSEERYAALPYLGFKGGIRLNMDESKIKAILEKIANCLSDAKGAETFWLPKLFYDIAKNNLDSSLGLIKGWIKSGDKSKIEMACDLITNLSHHLVIGKVDWVTELLVFSNKLSGEEFKTVRNSLYSLGTLYERHGTAGEPMPQDVSLVENAKRIQSEVKDQVVKDFYKLLEDYGLKEIERSKKEAARRFDG